MRLAIAAASVSLTACGLSVVGVASEATSEPDDAAAPVVVDAGTDAMRPPGTTDAGPGCTSVTDNFTTVDANKWTLMGGAQAMPGGGVILTPNNTSGQARAIWTKTALPLGSSVHVTVTFTDTIPPGGMDGDGIAIAWANKQGLGGSDKGLGICGASVTAVASLLYTTPLSPHLQVATAVSGDSCTTVGSVPANAPVAGVIELTVKPGSVTGTAPGGTQTEPATIPTTGYVGVTASTGNEERSGFTVTSITIASCP